MLFKNLIILWEIKFSNTIFNSTGLIVFTALNIYGELYTMIRRAMNLSGESIQSSHPHDEEMGIQVSSNKPPN